MSFFGVKQATTRLNRSELAVPGSSPDFFEKAAASNWQESYDAAKKTKLAELKQMFKFIDLEL